jgi:hypothetical protein
MDLVNISGLEGVVVGGDVDRDNRYQLVCAAFGLQSKIGSIGPVLKIMHTGKEPNLQDSFSNDIGKLQMEIFNAASIIIVLKNELGPLLTAALPNVLAKKVVSFSSIFGMEPKRFFTTSHCKTLETDQTDSEALTVHVACDIENYLINSKIFSAWMKYITGEIILYTSVFCYETTKTNF